MSASTLTTCRVVIRRSGSAQSDAAIRGEIRRSVTGSITCTENGASARWSQLIRQPRPAMGRRAPGTKEARQMAV
jgi:hypothetical protein